MKTYYDVRFRLERIEQRTEATIAKLDALCEDIGGLRQEMDAGFRSVLEAIHSCRGKEEG